MWPSVDAWRSPPYPVQRRVHNTCTLASQAVAVVDVTEQSCTVKRIPKAINNMKSIMLKWKAHLKRTIINHLVMMFEIMSCNNRLLTPPPISTVSNFDKLLSIIFTINATLLTNQIAAFISYCRGGSTQLY